MKFRIEEKKSYHIYFLYKDHKKAKHIGDYMIKGRN